MPSYLPGQFLTVRLRLPDGAKPAIRSYSLSDAPRPTHYRLTIKRIGPQPGEPQAASGLVSSYFHDRLAVGDRLDVKAPAGNFTIDPEAHDRPLVLVGGGIGITPLLSILQSIVAEGAPRETWLFHGIRDEREQIMKPQLEKIAGRHPNIHLHFFYSRPARVVDWPGRSGRAHRCRGHAAAAAFEWLSFLRLRAPGDDGRRHPGPRSVGRAGRAGAFRGVRPRDGQAGAARIGQPARLRHRRDVRPFRGDGAVERCDAPLLELAEEHAVAIDFGCRAGSCGTCVTRVLSGAVRYLHAPNAPLAAGEVLPCIAVPAERLVLDA